MFFQRVIIFVLALFAGFGAFFTTTAAQAHETNNAYIVTGDSIDFGLSATSPNRSYAALLKTFLETTYFGGRADLHNLAVPGATSLEIINDQSEGVRGNIKTHSKVAASIGGGGNDLLQFVFDPSSLVCLKSQATCLSRLNTLLDEIEQNMDVGIFSLRSALGPDAVIFVRAQYNPLMKASCGGPNSPLTQLGNLAMEGMPASALVRGLNQRLRDIAVKYDAKVIETFLPFFLNPEKYINSDCLHPTDAGHRAIRDAAIVAF